MTLDSIIDSLLLLTNACFINMLIISLIIFFFFFWFGKFQKTLQKHFMKTQKVCLGFFTKYLKLVNSIPDICGPWSTKIT